MARRWAAALTALAAMAGAGALAAADDAPESFVRALYGRYADEDFNVFAQDRDVFSKELLAAIAENDRCTPDDEVGALDFDPVCQCQDAGGMKSSVQAVRRTGDGRATAEVRLDWGEDVRRVRIDLVEEADGWRIADIATAGEQGLMPYLAEANRRACADR